ncbi:hypothetical protein [Allobaculum sp. Allo2]|nr:hypothetical protein [Allobaculum sp. Allo2]
MKREKAAKQNQELSRKQQQEADSGLVENVYDEIAEKDEDALA